MGWERQLAVDIRLELALSEDMPSDVESDDDDDDDNRSDSLTVIKNTRFMRLCQRFLSLKTLLQTVTL